MLYRKSEETIKEWVTKENKALLVTGARQVGKTFLIRQVLKESNKPFVEFNFIKQNNLIPIFNNAINEDADKFLMALRVAAKQSLRDDTIIFLDEIQEIKETLTLIKFLVEKGKYKYILSGSLLGVELNDLRSAPVGYLQTIDMYPMDIEEFYIANGLGQDVIQSIQNNFDNLTEINPFIHDYLIETFYRYLIVGGMPEAVQCYLDTQDLNKVSSIHKSIYREYKRDFSKYEKKFKLELINTYDIIPSELNSKNKRYTFTKLNKNLRFEKYENNFNWLVNAGVAIPTYNVTEFQIPLEASKKSNLFKLFLSDVGILTTLYGNATILKLLNKGKDINCGSMFENFVAQELIEQGFKPYYFNNKKHGEVDFLIEYNNELLPIEVKSGKDYQIHSALNYFMTTKHFKKAIVLSDYNISTKDNIIYLPIYMLMFIKNNFKLEKVSITNLSKLSNISY